MAPMIVDPSFELLIVDHHHHHQYEILPRPVT
ncbi:hypothetical protein T11_5840 [Trichinella zimbabwensis]|uniref:Uncharacterized protein n=1 Tax=Trichinella zimbabwensis TaxID=268475 RepID=A0A0V1DRB6_9BILA|nr:hypothetical protein T11_5840 [Trichinella zimbabwensis]